ncbi:MAG: M43 family zinc metalloprotease [Bacteroidota bacterium]
MKSIYIACLILILRLPLQGQILPCGQQELGSYYPESKQLEEAMNQTLLRAEPESIRITDEAMSLPVVFHLMEEENEAPFPDAFIHRQMLFLNQAFNNRAAFFGSKSVSSNIYFYLASLTPDGQETNGIIHHNSRFSTLASYEEDAQMKQQFHWDTRRYINVYLVRKGPATAYAHLPHFHGREEDGIVITYPHIGQKEELSTPLIHEMGHYLGLYHTFEGGCKNHNCLLQGDRVCDTPPDAGNAFFEGCDPNNSCGTDAQDTSSSNPLLSDHLDLNDNFMDYNRGRCLQNFTQGQINRMRLSIEKLRVSLLHTPGILSENVLSLVDITPEVITENIHPSTGNLSIFYTGEGEEILLQLSWEQEGSIISEQYLSQYMSPYGHYSLTFDWPSTLSKGPFSLTITDANNEYSFQQTLTFESPQLDVSPQTGEKILEASWLPIQLSAQESSDCLSQEVYHIHMADELLIDSHEYPLLNFGVGNGARYLDIGLALSFDPQASMTDSLQLWTSTDHGENWQRENWGLFPESLIGINQAWTASTASPCQAFEQLQIPLPKKNKPYVGQLRYQSFGKGVDLFLAKQTRVSTSLAPGRKRSEIHLMLNGQNWYWTHTAQLSPNALSAHLIDIHGRRIPLSITSASLESTSVTISSELVAGFYFLHIENEEAPFLKKVILR